MRSDEAPRAAGVAPPARAFVVAARAGGIEPHDADDGESVAVARPHFRNAKAARFWK